MKRELAREAMAARMRDLRAFIEAHPERATLAELARRAHLSPSYLQRRFRAIMGSRRGMPQRSGCRRCVGGCALARR